MGYFSHETPKYVTYETLCMFHVKTIVMFFNKIMITRAIRYTRYISDDRIGAI